MARKPPEQNPRLKQVYLEVVENQLRNNDPPETRQTLDRLRGKGYSDGDAKLLIASAIAAESFQILKTKTPFNQERFIRYLNQLPDQDFED